MPKDSFKLLDVVALREDLLERGLVRGQVGTILELLAPASLKSSSATMKAGRTHHSP